MAQVETEKRRYAILAHLYRTEGRELGHEMLREACDALGVLSQPDQVRAAMRWLEELELVTLGEVGAILTARLTPAGADLVRRRRPHDGILIFGDLV